MIEGYREFEFDLPGALLANLVQIFIGIDLAPLDLAHVDVIPEEQGVYMLFLDGEPVYVGKTDSEAGLHKRLARHRRKILHRNNLDPVRVSFKAVRIFVFTAMDMESDLIRHYGGVGGLAWNGSGFGSNDPGRERDTTKNKPENFDAMYPIDIDRQIDETLPPGEAVKVFDALRAAVPYVIRRQRQADMKTVVTGLAPPYTVREAVTHLVAELPPGWQATKLLGYVIVYKENKDYPDMELIARS